MPKWLALVVVVLLAGGASLWWLLQPEKSEDTQAQAFEEFQNLLQQEAGAVVNPWVLAHLALAFGPDIQDACSRLENDFLKRRADFIGFDIHGPGGSLGEVHPHLVLKTWTELGWNEALCRELAAAAIESFRWPTNYEEWNDTAWLLEALGRLGYDAQTPIAGNHTLAELTVGALTRVEEAHRVVEAALARRAKQGFQRPGGAGPPSIAGIWAYTCGGQHLLQGVLVAAEHGLLPATEKDRLRRRVSVFLERLEGETEFRLAERKRALGAGISPIRVEAQYLRSLLKLHGHGLETLARAQRANMAPASEIEAAARASREFVLTMPQQLLDRGVDLVALMPKFRNQAPLDWQLWFGDGCHAIRGLSYWP